MDDQGTSDALPPCEDEHAPDDLMTDDKDETAGPQTTLKSVAEVMEGTEATEEPDPYQTRRFSNDWAASTVCLKEKTI